MRIRNIRNNTKNLNFFILEYQSLIHKQYWEENKHQKKFFKIQKNYTSSYVNESLLASTSTNYDLNTKIADWERRNNCYKNNSSVNTSEDNDSVQSEKSTTYKTLQPPKGFYSTTSQREEDCIKEMKRLDISNLPMNKRYDFATQTEIHNNEMSSDYAILINKKLK